jgi:hypothetical protein
MEAFMSEEFNTVFKRLKSILQVLEPKLVLIKDEPDYYYLNLHHTRADGYQWFFGSVQIKKNYVSYHLIGVYVYPELLDGISSELRKRLQGKSCFNFKKSDEPIFQELEVLTHQCLAQFKEAGMT